MEHIVSKRCFEPKKHPFDIQIEQLARENARLDKQIYVLTEATKFLAVVTVFHAWYRFCMWVLS